jgi:hypothetical protein
MGRYSRVRPIVFRHTGYIYGRYRLPRISEEPLAAVIVADSIGAAVLRSIDYRTKKRPVAASFEGLAATFVEYPNIVYVNVTDVVTDDWGQVRTKP